MRTEKISIHVGAGAKGINDRVPSLDLNPEQAALIPLPGDTYHCPNFGIVVKRRTFEIVDDTMHVILYES